MADPADGITAQIRGIEQRHGKPIAVWIELMKAGSLSKHPDVVAMLKNDHRITHGAAHRIALLARNAGQPGAGFAHGSCGCALRRQAGGPAADPRPTHRHDHDVVQSAGT